MIRLWHATASSDDPGRVETLCDQYLSAADRARADQFRRLTSRNQHIVGRGMARRIVAGKHADPEAWLYDDEPGGKPRFRNIADHPPMLFNVSHTDGLVVCGVCQVSQALGVDVERTDRRIDVAMAERYFAAPEVDYVRGQANESAARQAFLTIWTLKESFIKAIGTGLRTPLADFAMRDIDSPHPRVEFLDPSLVRHANCGHPSDWHLRSFRPRDGYIAAAAVWRDSRVDDDSPIELCNFDELVDGEIEK